MLQVDSDRKWPDVFEECSKHLTRLDERSGPLLHWDRGSLQFSHNLYEKVRKSEMPRGVEKAEVLIVTPLPEERRAVLAKFRC
jgi:hypothetical protein